MACLNRGGLHRVAVESGPDQGFQVHELGGQRAEEVIFQPDFFQGHAVPDLGRDELEAVPAAPELLHLLERTDRLARQLD